MVTLKVAIDASGAVQGAQQVNRAVEDIGRTTDRTVQRIDRIGRNVAEQMPRATADVLKLNRAIETVGEVTQVGTRVRILGEEIRNLGSASGSASGAVAALGGALFDVAQITEKTGGRFGAFVTVLRANPLLAAAGVLSLIASAMAIFGGETEQTTGKIREQVDALEDLRRAGQSLQDRVRIDEELGRAGFGVDTSRAAEDRARLLVEQIAKLRTQGNYLLGSEVQGITGLSAAEIARRAPAGSIGFLPGMSSGDPNARTPFSITPEGLRDVLRELAAELRRTAQAGSDIQVPRFGATPYGPPAPPGGPFQSPQAPSNLYPDVLTVSGGVGYGSPIGPMAGEESPFARVSRLNQIQDAERQLAEFNERLAQTRQLGVDVGNALGNSFFAFLQNANNARGVLVGLLQQLSAIAQQRIVSGFANSVGNLFGSTVTQQSSNPGFVGPPVAPGFQSDN